MYYYKAEIRMAKVLMITGNFTEDYETTVPFQTLLACDRQVDAVCRLPLWALAGYLWKIA